jgi:hypothetical protein
MAAAVFAVMVDALPAAAASTTTTAPGGAIPAEALRRIADQFNGSYVGRWVDSTGARGSGTGTISIDPSAQRAKGTLAVGGKILGRSPLGRRTFSVDLSKYGYDADAVSVPTSPWGAISWTRVSGGAQLTLAGVPGLASGSNVEIIGRFTHPGFASFTYTITPAKGKAVRGAVNAGKRGTTFADPVVPSESAASTAALLSGAYACSLLTKADAAKAFAEPAKAAEPNGGRLAYAVGIDTSNCRVESVSGNQLLQMTVYHGHSADDAAKYFEVNRAIGTPVPGLESRAYSFLNGRTVWVLAGDDVVELNVIDQRSSDLPPALASFVQSIATKGS